MSNNNQSTLQQFINEFIRENNLPRLKGLIERFNFDINSNEGSNKQTPLHYACEQGNVEMVEYLLEKGANPNARTHKDNSFNKDYYYEKGISEFQTPVMTAIEYGKLEVVKYFHKKGLLAEDPKMKVHAQCLKIAIRSNRFEIVKFLCSEAGVSVESMDAEGKLHADGRPPFVQAAAGGNLEMMRYFYSLNCNVNAQVDTSIVDSSIGHGDTALVASLVIGYGWQCSRERMVKFLIDEAKVDVNLGNPKGRLPLVYALSECSREIVEMLMKAGANIFAGTGSVISASKYQNDKTLARKFYEMGANPFLSVVENRFPDEKWIMKTKEVLAAKKLIRIGRSIAKLSLQSRLIFRLIATEILRNFPCYSLGAISDSINAILDLKTLTVKKNKKATKPILKLATNNHQQHPKFPYYQPIEEEQLEYLLIEQKGNSKEESEKKKVTVRKRKSEKINKKKRKRGKFSQ